VLNKVRERCGQRINDIQRDEDAQRTSQVELTQRDAAGGGELAP
jgi:hypothetical protein